MPKAPAPGFLARLDGTRAWVFMAAIGAIVGVLGAGSLASSRFYDAFVGPYIWRPIVTDAGYNPINTGLVIVLILLLVGWTRALLARFGQLVDRELVIASIPYTVWGPVLRVLEDADLFAPYAGPGASPNAACALGVSGGLLDRCFGVLFITPINFLWIIPALVAFARIG